MPDEAELAVNRYLNFLADPSSILDTNRISVLEAELAAATNPLKKLHAHAALEKARRSDGDDVREAFVKHALPYAVAHDISVSSFRSVGVSDIALAEAGFDLGHGRIKAKIAKATRTPLPGGRLRAPKVSKSSIQNHIMQMSGSFTLNDVILGIGGSIATVNTVVKEMVGAGSIKQLGPDTNHQGRGRAPIRYSR
jgi:hypothetical protein